MKVTKLSATFNNGPANNMVLSINPDQYGGYPKILHLELPDIKNKKFKYKFIHRKKNVGYYDYIGM